MNAVIDASVLLMAYFDDEEGHAQAQQLIRDYASGGIDLFAPGLLAYEIMNACLVAVRTKRLGVDSARDTIGAILGMDITMVNAAAIADTVIELSARFDISAYDACYLALAKSKGCVLITADKKLYNKLSPDIPWIKLIHGYPSIG